MIKAFPFLVLILLCRASDLAAVCTTFNVFSYDAVWAEVLITFPREADALRVTLDSFTHLTITPILLKLSLPLN